jgi:4-hydroxybenzoate polyprenyltransferase
MTRLELTALALALPVGLGIAKLDSRSDEVQGAVLLLLLSGAALGAMVPRLAPATGLLLGAGVPLTYLYMQHAHIPSQANGFAGTLLALIPPTLGALAGAWLRVARQRA